MSIYVLPVRQDGRYFMTSVIGSVVDQQKDVSLFLDDTGEPAAQQGDSSRLKNNSTQTWIISFTSSAF